ncbi:hypothetical protein [Amycolatopsis sp. GM8]|uniref:hypothetical protein n=1 Tax=Amycolatopsis sp. GM8 TaxID=2896530 RepID=UPI001F1E945B|nr:hypothetical protein [Amycolatopsis sp. GM8]
MSWPEETVMPGIPLPGPDIANRPANQTSQLVLEIAVAVAVVLMLYVGVRVRQRWGTWLGLVIVIATGFGSGVELLFNTTANFWYYAPGAHELITSWGRQVPAWAAGSYIPFYGGLGILGWYLIERGASRLTLALYGLAIYVVFIVTEIVLVGIGLYAYYGDQPWQIASFPIWISAANVAICLTIAVGASRISRGITGWRVWPLIGFGPVLIGGYLVGSSWPMITALKGDNPSTAQLWLSGAAATVIAVACVAAILGLVPRRGRTDTLLPRQRVSGDVRQFGATAENGVRTLPGGG